MNIKNHILEGVKLSLSSNHDDRPENSEISLIVIHSISLPPTIFGNNYVEEFFLNKLPVTDNLYLNNIRGMKVSSHLYIKRSGEIIQFVPFDKRAWHAGQSSFENIKNCNDYSIGIELEGTSNSVFEDEQYNKLKEIIKLMKTSYPKIVEENIIGHNKVAPGRKEDPGVFFDWDKIKG